MNCGEDFSCKKKKKEQKKTELTELLFLF